MPIVSGFPFANETVAHSKPLPAPDRRTSQPAGFERILRALARGGDAAEGETAPVKHRAQRSPETADFHDGAANEPQLETPEDLDPGAAEAWTTDMPPQLFVNGILHVVGDLTTDMDTVPFADISAESTIAMNVGQKLSDTRGARDDRATGTGGPSPNRKAATGVIGAVAESRALSVGEEGKGAPARTALTALTDRSTRWQPAVINEFGRQDKAYVAAEGSIQSPLSASAALQMTPRETGATSVLSRDTLVLAPAAATPKAAAWAETPVAAEPVQPSVSVEPVERSVSAQRADDPEPVVAIKAALRARPVTLAVSSRTSEMIRATAVSAGTELDRQGDDVQLSAILPVSLSHSARAKSGADTRSATAITSRLPETEGLDPVSQDEAAIRAEPQLIDVKARPVSRMFEAEAPSSGTDSKPAAARILGLAVAAVPPDRPGPLGREDAWQRVNPSPSAGHLMDTSADEQAATQSISVSKIGDGDAPGRSHNEAIGTTKRVAEITIDEKPDSLTVSAVGRMDWESTGDPSATKPGSDEIRERERSALVAPLAERLQQIIETITRERGPGGNEQIAIKLHPEHLGRLRLTVGIDEHGVVHARFVADNAAVRAMIEQDMGQLRALLEERGLILGETGVHADVGSESGADNGGLFADAGSHSFSGHGHAHRVEDDASAASSPSVAVNDTGNGPGQGALTTIDIRI